MTPRPRVASPPGPRKRFRQRRARVFAVSGVVVSFLAAVGWLLVAPHELASVRLLGVSLAWWGGLVAQGLGVAALVVGLRDKAAEDRQQGGSPG